VTTIPRLMLFEQYPCSLLLHASPDQLVKLPPLRAPFSRLSVQQVCREYLTDFRVIEAHPRRWRETIEQAESSLKAEQGQHTRMQQAQSAQILLGANCPREQERARLVQRKLEVVERLRDLKAIFERTRPSNRSRRGEIQSRIECLTQEHLHIDSRLSELKRTDLSTKQERARSVERRFVTLAKTRLPKELFRELLNEAIAQVELRAEEETNQQTGGTSHGT